MHIYSKYDQLAHMAGLTQRLYVGGFLVPIQEEYDGWDNEMEWWDEGIECLDDGTAWWGDVIGWQIDEMASMIDEVEWREIGPLAGMMRDGMTELRDDRMW